MRMYAIGMEVIDDVIEFTSPDVGFGAQSITITIEQVPAIINYLKKIIEDDE